MSRLTIVKLVAGACAVLFSIAASAEERIEASGATGAPDATTTISGKQLPAPQPPFGGEIKNDALQSKTWWAPRIVPPKQAPNVLLIITDDSGLACRARSAA
jgi:arylsulfatase